MADQGGHYANPIGLDTIFEDVADVCDTQPEGWQEQREVNHLIDEDVTDGTEQHNAPLSIVVDDLPTNAGEDQTLPGSAFSADSSDEDIDVGAYDDGADEGDDKHDGSLAQNESPEDDERAEHDEDQKHDQGADENDSTMDPAGAEKYQGEVAQTVYGSNEHPMLFKHNWKPYHPDRDSNKEDHQVEGDNHRFHPSKLHITSSPDSPVSPEDTQPTTQIGVLPELSPELEDNRAVSPLFDHDETSTPMSASFAAVRQNWSEDDEDDDSWVSSALAEMSTSRRGSKDSTDEALPEVSQAETKEALDPEASNLSENEEEDGDKQEEKNSESGNDVLSPVSPLEETDEHSEAATVTSQVAEGSQSTTMPNNMRDPMSPTPDGPELLTGLRPTEGIDAWWEWHDRAQPGTLFRSLNPENQDGTGDLKLDARNSDDRSEAATVLLKQRIMLKKMKGGRNSEKSMWVDNIPFASDTMSDLERTQEYLKLQMLKYRWERNKFRYLAERGRLYIEERDEILVEERERVSRRDQTIKHLQDDIKESEEAADRAFKEAERQFNEVLEEMEAENKRIRMFSAQYKKSAEKNADEVRRERARRNASFHMSSIMTVISQEPDVITAANDSDSTFDTLSDASGEDAPGPAARRPAPEHEVNWPLRDRPHLVKFMVRWINENREPDSTDDDLKSPQLDEILGAGFLSWDELIDRLRDLGFLFRPDRLALALADPASVSENKLPRPNLAVIYAARRLNADNAVPRLLQEVGDLRTEIANTKSPAEMLYRIHELETENLGLQGSQPVHLAQQVSELQLALAETQDSEIATVKQLEREIGSLKAKLVESEEACATWDESCTDLHAQIAGLERQVAQKVSDTLDNATKSQMEAEAEALRSQLQKKNDLEAELAACRAHSEQLQSRKDELEIELEVIEMTRQANATSNSDLDRIQAAEEVLRDQQASIDDLEAQLRARCDELNTTQRELFIVNNEHEDLKAFNVSLQQRFDDTTASSEAEKIMLQNQLDLARHEVDTLYEEGRSLREALLVHNKDPSSTSETVSSPLSKAQQQRPRVQASVQSSRWADRKRAILDRQSTNDALELLRAAREERQAAELQRVNQMCQMVGGIVGELQGRFVAVTA